MLLLGAGALTTHRVALVESDEELREELREHLQPFRTSVDDQLRHVPAYAAVGLSLMGVTGTHSPGNQALLFALTYTLNNALTSNLKRLTHVERPQGNSFDSFPSQHTSAAFSAARLLDREYGERSVWYSVGGYAVATGSPPCAWRRTTTGAPMCWRGRAWACSRRSSRTGCILICSASWSKACRTGPSCCLITKAAPPDFPSW
ncbi:hypothetical protein ACFQT0_31300 [Hymenobacter humi]|uniref:Phosphatase PAP2 family protein n=1 Tax=Hymenobacter humi TaxID=1411620 RepID=A0ABW2UEZ6_9BACT